MSLAHPFTPLTINDDVGQILFTPCPGTKEVGLQNSLDKLAAIAATAILIMMPKDEMLGNAVTDLPELCSLLGLEWFHLPIEDDHATAQAIEDAWQLASAKIHALIDAGKSIA